MSRWAKVGLVSAGYVLAIAAAVVAGYLYDVRMSAMPYDTSGGMYAGGEAMLALAVFLAVALVPTLLGLWFLRGNRKLWQAAGILSIAFASAGLLAVLLPLLVPDYSRQPGLLLFSLLGLAQLLGEERVVVLEVEAEQWKRLDGRASADHHFGPAARQQVERREFLEHTNRVGSTQHRHRTRESDGLRARRGRAEDHGRSGVEELAAVVLSNAKRIQPELIGVLDLLDQIAQTVGCADRAAVLGERRREAVDADFHLDAPLPDLAAAVRQQSSALRSAGKSAGRVQRRTRLAYCCTEPYRRRTSAAST